LVLVRRLGRDQQVSLSDQVLRQASLLGLRKGRQQTWDEWIDGIEETRTWAVEGHDPSDLYDGLHGRHRGWDTGAHDDVP
jgi:hypothetical protein